MATRKVVTGSWSLRYFAQKLQLGVQETLGQLPTSGSASAALTKGVEAFRAPVATVLYFTGAAMVTAPLMSSAGRTRARQRNRPAFTAAYCFKYLKLDHGFFLSAHAGDQEGAMNH